MNLRFAKMHGLGNDFVIVDCRTQPFALSLAQIAKIGDRHFGVRQNLAGKRGRQHAMAPHNQWHPRSNRPDER